MTRDDFLKEISNRLAKGTGILIADYVDSKFAEVNQPPELIQQCYKAKDVKIAELEKEIARLTDENKILQERNNRQCNKLGRIRAILSE